MIAEGLALGRPVSWAQPSQPRGGPLCAPHVVAARQQQSCNVRLSYSVPRFRTRCFDHWHAEVAATSSRAKVLLSATVRNKLPSSCQRIGRRALRNTCRRNIWRREMPLARAVMTCLWPWAAMMLDAGGATLTLVAAWDFDLFRFAAAVPALLDQTWVWKSIRATVSLTTLSVMHFGRVSWILRAARQQLLAVLRSSACYHAQNRPRHAPCLSVLRRSPISYTISVHFQFMLCPAVAIKRPRRRIALTFA